MYLSIGTITDSVIPDAMLVTWVLMLNKIIPRNNSPSGAVSLLPLGSLAAFLPIFPKSPPEARTRVLNSARLFSPPRSTMASAALLLSNRMALATPLLSKIFSWRIRNARPLTDSSFCEPDKRLLKVSTSAWALACHSALDS